MLYRTIASLPGWLDWVTSMDIQRYFNTYQDVSIVLAAKLGVGITAVAATGRRIRRHPVDFFISEAIGLSFKCRQYPANMQDNKCYLLHIWTRMRGV